MSNHFYLGFTKCSLRHALFACLQGKHRYSLVNEIGSPHNRLCSVFQFSTTKMPPHIDVNKIEESVLGIELVDGLEFSAVGPSGLLVRHHSVCTQRFASQGWPPAAMVSSHSSSTAVNEGLKTANRSGTGSAHPVHQALVHRRQEIWDLLLRAEFRQGALYGAQCVG